MKYSLLVLYLILRFYSALSSLPAPVNVSMNSLNFHNVLCWDPGPGTPAGTRYQVFRRVNNRTSSRQLTNETCFTLKLTPKKFFRLSVKASYNHSTSPESSAIIFSPFAHTRIGPPKLSLAGCDNCIQINISLPEADTKAKLENDIQTFYGASFTVWLWKKADRAQRSSINIQERSYTLNNLDTGTEYCVQVYTNININRNTLPSDVMCTFTTVLDPSRVPAIVGGMAAALIFGGFVLMALMFCLFYTGFICKLKARLPTALLWAPVPDHVLTAERTIPDLVSVTSEADVQPKSHNPRTPLSANVGRNREGEEDGEEEEDEEEEEEEGDKLYMNRKEDLSSGASSCRDSCNTSGASKPAVSGDSGCLSVRSSAEPEEADGVVVTWAGHGGRDQAEADTERAEGSFVADGDQIGSQGHEMGGTEEEKEEESDNFGNINLFSITLGSLARNEEQEQEKGDSSGSVNLFSITLGSLERNEEQEEEEESTRDSLIDFSNPSDQKPLLSADLQWTSGSTQTESQIPLDHQTPLALTQPTQTDFGGTGYESRQAESTDTFSSYLVTRGGETQTEEEEEEEEISGYMGR